MSRRPGTSRPDAQAGVDAWSEGESPPRPEQRSLQSTARAPGTRARRWLAGPGLPCIIMVLVALSFALVYPLLPYHDRLTDQGKIVSYHPLAFVGFVGGIGIFAASYARMLSIARATSLSHFRWPITLTTTALLLAFTMMYPTNAIDVFIYAARSHLLTTYIENPNRVMPLDFWDIDPFVRFSSKQWADNVSPYGPLWNLIAAPVTAFDGDRILAAVLGFKLINIVALVAIGGFIYHTMLVRAPHRALAAALLWTWNPLVLWEGVGNAHNDVIMMLPIAAALWAWESGRTRWVLPLIVTSILIKYVAIVIAPVVLVACLRRETTARGRVQLLGIALIWTSLLALISLYPFFDVGALWLSIQDQGARFSGSIGYLIVRGGRRLGGGEQLTDVVQELGFVLATGAMVIGAIACWVDPRRLPHATLAIMTVFLLFGTMTFRPWYVIWIVALAAFTVSRGACVRSVVWSLTALLGYGHYVWVRRIWPVEQLDWLWFEVAGVLITLGPIVVLSLGAIWRWCRHRIS